MSIFELGRGDGYTLQGHGNAEAVAKPTIDTLKGVVQSLKGYDSRSATC